MWMYLLKLTPPIENRTVTQAVRQIVATASHNSGLLSKNGLPSSIPTRLNILWMFFITAYKRSLGKVMFSQASVCQSFCLGDWVHHMHQGLSHMVGNPPPRHGTFFWHLMVITVDPFKLVHLRTHPDQYWHLVVAIETCTVGKWAVGILLQECFLVLL